MYRVYKRTAPDGRVYIGCTSQPLQVRAGSSGKGYQENAEFWEAIQEFGWDNFTHEILLETEDRELAARTEIEYIQKYNSTDLQYGFNKRIQTYITDEGYSARLSKAIKEGTTEKSRSQRSESLKRYYLDPENREFHRKRMLRVINRPEVREKLRKASIRNNARPEVKAKIKESLRKYWTDERRAQHGEMIKAKLAPEDVRLKISEGTKQGLSSAETRRKMSDAQYTKWADPEYRERVTKSMKVACNTPEHRKKVSEAQKVAQNRPEVKAKISKAFTGFIFINNGIVNKRVYEEEAQKLIATGEWRRGKLPMGPRKNKSEPKIWIHRSDESKMILPTDLPQYQAVGWELGRGKLK